jgi:hypothetical protein
MVKKVKTKKDDVSSQFIFCYWDEYTALPNKRVEDIKNKTKRKL